jgi:hypothetical protein
MNHIKRRKLLCTENVDEDESDEISCRVQIINLTKQLNNSELNERFLSKSQ